jgi:hypothetical protein
MNNINETKYNVVLKYVNKILQNLNKPVINNLVDFKDIDRLDIINENNTKTFNEMVPELFAKGLFDKMKSGYYRKSDAIALNCLRGILKDINYEFVYKEREISHEINGTKYRKTHSFYSINKNI